MTAISAALAASEPSAISAASETSDVSAVSAAAGLTLDPAQRQTVLAEVEALEASLPPAAQGRYAGLIWAIGVGEIGQALVPRLEEVLDLSLSTGRTRRVHGAEGEQALLSLFRQTPRGLALARTVEAANRALSALAGQAIRGISFSPRAPGALRLEIGTDTCQVVLEIDRAGVTVDSVEV